MRPDSSSGSDYCGDPCEANVSADQLTIGIVPRDGYVTLHSRGEIDMCTSPLLRDAALRAMRDHATTLHLDMKEVTFMDSTRFEALLATRRRVDQEGGRLILCQPSRSVLRVLEVTGVARLFEFDTEPACTAL